MIPSSLIFRSMQPEDIPRALEIDRLSFSMPWPESSFRFELEENEASKCWVAEIQTSETTPEMIGMAVVWQLVDQAHIATFAVHPAYRGLGIGEEMLKFILRAAQDDGMLSATLEVRITNLVALKLYRKLGFQVTGRRLRYYHDTQEDALIMTVALPIPARAGG